MQLRIDPTKVDDAAIASIKDKIQRSGIYVSSLAVDGNHIDPDPAAREKQNKYTITCMELCGKLGIPNIGGQSGTIKGRPLQEQVDEIVKVYNEKYFPVCEKNKVRILWEPYAGGPNIAHRTGRVGGAVQVVQGQPARGAAVRSLAPGVAVHGPGAGGSRFRRQDLRRTPEGQRDPLACRAARRIHPVNNATLVALPGSGLWLGRLEGLLRGTGRKRLYGRDEYRERRRVLLPGLRSGEFHEQFKRGFRVAHEFLKTMVPPLNA